MKQSTLKNLAKEAKSRIKSGYWQKSIADINSKIEYARSNGLNESTVVSYYRERVKSDLRVKNAEEESFYLKVKKVLDEHGEVSDILGRIADKEYLQSLSYEQRQKYLLSLSENYRKALSRYKKEKELGL